MPKRKSHSAKNKRTYNEQRARTIYCASPMIINFRMHCWRTRMNVHWNQTVRNENKNETKIHIPAHTHSLFEWYIQFECRFDPEPLQILRANSKRANSAPWVKTCRKNDFSTCNIVNTHTHWKIRQCIDFSWSKVKWLCRLIYSEFNRNTVISNDFKQRRPLMIC